MKRRNVLITGASSGVGAALAVELARAGGRIGLVGRDAGRLEEVRQRVLRAGGVPLAFQVDFRDLQAVEALAVSAARGLDPLDALIHSAGVIYPAPFETARITDFWLQFTVNVAAPFVLTQGLLPLLRTRQASIVFVNSSVVSFPAAGTIQYAATKHALRGVADGLRAELDSRGPRVFTVYLGRTATPMQKRVCQAEGREYLPDQLLQPEDVARAVVGLMNLPVSAEATEVFLRPARKPMAAIRRPGKARPLKPAAEPESPHQARTL